ncbi:MAG TPA: thioredoxin domain-containing protein [Pyrinomonadaceae bacterium]|jgi:protein-disulfide isomerase|nr:thioredoxin domain-containing protein [Pyrinomonadaceae bacterium]
MKRNLPFIIIALVLVLALAGGAYLLRSPGGAQGTAHPNTNGGVASSNSSTSPTPLGKPSNGAEPPHLRGDANAPVLIEEFGDFQCPPCGALYPLMKKIEGESGTRVRVIFREFPLAKIHKNALDAARAAEAAGLQGRFWEMHDVIYEKQGDWSVMPDARPVFAEFARELKLDVDRFNSDMDTLQVNSRISADMSRAESLGVKGTPTVFINGSELSPANMTLEGIRAAINAAPKGKSQ